MLRPFCRCKIHRATVTSASLDYVGSMTIPATLMKSLDIRTGEQIDVANVSTGTRWTTYAIPGKKAGDFCLNGAAARLGAVGDKVIILVYALLDEEEARHYRMKVAHLGEKNKVLRISG
ncbi:MAG: aspartate 1-decarboxylase [Planctomycetota bacterium]